MIYNMRNLYEIESIDTDYVDDNGVTHFDGYSLRQGDEGAVLAYGINGDVYYCNPEYRQYPIMCEAVKEYREQYTPKNNTLHLFYPSATEWMWDYCIYLGSFIDSRGTKFDLGIYIDERDESADRILAAIVYGDEPGNYYSGELNRFGLDGHPMDEKYEETRRRAENLGYYKPNLRK